MWRPSLPELKAGKADTDCPSEADYYEVCYTNNLWHNNDEAELVLSSLKNSLLKGAGLTTLP